MDNPNWQAQWIWAEGDETQRYFYFRREFELPSEPVKATLRITADDRYRVWVNGGMPGNGPVRSKPSHQSYDEYDKHYDLKAGANVIAVLATHYGIGTAYSCIGKPGLLAQLDVTFEDGSTMIIGTDADWKCLPAPYENGYERMCIMLAYPEVYDLRGEPDGWDLPWFNDSDWNPAIVLGPVGIEPWTNLLRREIPLPAYRSSNSRLWGEPWEVARISKVVDAYRPESAKKTPAEDMESAACLEEAPYQPDSEEAFFEANTKDPSLLFIAPQAGGEGVSFTLDFGKEISGFPFLDIDEADGGRIDIGYSERLEADGTVNPNHWGGPPVHYADRIFLRHGKQEFKTFDPRAFRYMRLDIYDNPAWLVIRVHVDEIGYPLEKKGQFECSDALLNRIWQVGRYTTELCMDDAFMDCPWRERGQYLGDLAVEMRIAAYAFGDTLLARRGLAQFPLGADAKGWFPGVYPAEPPWYPVLPAFCFLWMIALWDYFLLTGDRKLLEEVWPAVDRLTRTIAERDDDGLFSDWPADGFVDHAKVQQKGQSTAMNAFAVWGLQAAGRIARAIGIPGRGGDFDILAHDMADAINDMMWDNERGAYIDGYLEGQPNRALSEHANILCALTGIADARQTARIFDGVLASDSPDIIRIASPYFSYYLLRLLFSHGQHTQALAYIREKWGAMIEAGATTFWEMWKPEASLCHAWSASPTYDLMSDIAGIRPTQPGFEEFTVHPHPCHLTWFRTTVPTPHGDISLGYHRTIKTNRRDPNGPPIFTGTVINLTVPENTLADVRLPLPANIPAPLLRINDKIVWEQGKPLPGANKYRREGDFLAFSAGSGSYHIAMEDGTLSADN